MAGRFIEDQFGVIEDLEDAIMELRKAIRQIRGQIGCGCGYNEGMPGLGGDYGFCHECKKAKELAKSVLNKTERFVVEEEE